MKTRKNNLGLLMLQAVSTVLFFGYFAITSLASAATLPEGDCADPKPYTDLTDCRFKGADLKNKDLQGTDLRGIIFYKTQLQGANLTNALVDGRYITYAFLDGVIGLPTEALAILKTSYLVTPNGKDDFLISVLPSNYKGSNENVAGLDNIFLAQKAAETQSTLALLAHPKYGDSQKSAIFARFDNDKFDFPACYRSVNLMNDGHTYYWPHWESLKIRPLNNGGYLIGVLAFGHDGDDMGQSEWRKVAFLELTSTCNLSVLHEEFLDRGGKSIKRNGEYIEEWCGGELDYRFIDDQTAEIKMIFPVSSKKVCGSAANPREKIVAKQIKLNLHQ